MDGGKAETRSCWSLSAVAGSLLCPARGPTGRPGANGNVAGEMPCSVHTPDQGRATESNQSSVFCLLTELLHPFPSHLALWIELPGGFSPPWDGGEDRSKQAKPTRSSAGLGSELRIPRLGLWAQPLPEPGLSAPAHPETRAMGAGITHLVLVAGWDGEDGAAVHLPHEELGHTVREEYGWAQQREDGQRQAGLSPSSTRPASEGPGEGQGSRSCNTGFSGDQLSST